MNNEPDTLNISQPWKKGSDSIYLKSIENDSAKKNSKIRLAILLISLLIITGILTGLFSWYEKPGKMSLFLLTNDARDNSSPYWSITQGNVKLLRESNLFYSIHNLNEDILKTNPVKHRENGSNIIYIDCKFIIDQNNEVMLKGQSLNNLNETFIKLKDVIHWLNTHLVNNTVLVFNASLPDNSISDHNDAQKIKNLIHDNIITINKPNVLVLFPNANGESDHIIPDKGHGLFLHFFVEGLRGAADPFSGLEDGTIKSLGLVRYLNTRMNNWLDHYGFDLRPFTYWVSSDDPFLIRKSGEQFNEDLGILNQKIKYPEWLVKAWKTLEEWKIQKKYVQQPLLYQKILKTVQSTEDLWSIGYNQAELKSSLDFQLATTEEKYKKSISISSLDRATFANYEKDLSVLEQNSPMVNNTIALIKNNRIITSDQIKKSEEKSKMSDELVEKWFRSFPEGSSIFLQNACIIEASLIEKWIDVSDIILMNKCLERIGGAVMIESALIQYFDKFADKYAQRYDYDVYYELFKSRSLRESIFSQFENWSASARIYRNLFDKQNELEMFVLFGGQGDNQTVLNEIIQLNTELDSIKSDLAMMKKAREMLYLTMQDIYWMPLIIEHEPEKSNIVFDYFQKQIRLTKSLHEFDEMTTKLSKLILNSNNQLDQNTNSKISFQNELHSIELVLERLITARESLLNYYNDNIFLSIRNEMNSHNTGSKVHLTRLLYVLRLPFLTSEVRESLWNQMFSYFESQSDLINDLQSNDTPSRPLLLSDISLPIQSQTQVKLEDKPITKFQNIISSDSAMSETFKSNDLQNSQINHPHPEIKISNQLGKKYPPEILKYPGFAELLDQLFKDSETPMNSYEINSIVSNSNHLDYLPELRNMRRQYSQVFPISSIEIAIFNFYSEADNNAYRLLPKFNTSVKNMRITSEQQKTGQVDLELSVSIEKSDLLVEPFKIQVMNMPGSIMVYKSEETVISNDAQNLQETLSFNLKKEILFSVNYLLLSDGQKINVIGTEQVIPLKIICNEMTQYLFIPIRINWKSSLPTIEFQSVQNPLISFNDIRFRPISKVNTLPVMISNHTSNEKKYKVNFSFSKSDGSSPVQFTSDEIKISPLSKSTIKLKESSTDVPDSTRNILPEKESGKKPDNQNSWPGLQIPVGSEFQVQIFDTDNSSKDPLVNELRRMTFFNPREYFSTGMPVYDGQAKKLSISLSGDKEMYEKQPAQVRLNLDPSFYDNTKKSEKGGKLDGLFDFQSDSPIDLLAQPVSPPFFDNGSVSRFWIDIDNHKRSFTYQNRWSKDTANLVNPLPVVNPEIKLIMPEMAGTKTPVPIKIEPINEPENSSVILEIATSQIYGPFQPIKYRTLHKFNSSRKALYAVGLDAKTGSLVVNTDYDDWSYDLQTTGLVGRVHLRARLLDQFGKELATHDQSILIDDQLPENNDVVNLPRFAKPGSSVEIVFTTTQPPSGIAEVSAFPGTLTDGKMAEGVKSVSLNPVELKKSDEIESTAKSVLSYYKGKVQIPDKIQAPGETMITIVAKSKAGETVTIQRPIRIVSADYSEPGAISGTVLLSERPQPDLPVVLRKMDKNRTEVGRTRTDAQGRFKLNTILPGNYGIFTARSIDQTSAQADVNVEPGSNTELKLVLGRVNLPSNGPPPQEKTEPAESKSK